MLQIGMSCFLQSYMPCVIVNLSGKKYVLEGRNEIEFY